MALVISKIADAPDHVVGNRRQRIRLITGDSSYPTAGESLTPADVGLRRIEEARPCGAFKTSSGTTAINVTYDHANKKLLAHWGNAGTAGVIPEVTDTTDISTFSGRMIFVGV